MFIIMNKWNIITWSDNHEHSALLQRYQTNVRKEHEVITRIPALRRSPSHS